MACPCPGPRLPFHAAALAPAPAPSTRNLVFGYVHQSGKNIKIRQDLLRHILGQGNVQFAVFRRPVIVALGHPGVTGGQRVLRSPLLVAVASNFKS